MAYAIMRAKKLANMGSVAASMQHCYRERNTHNADQERTPDNQHLVAKSTDEAMGKLRDLLPEKRRKDAVLAVEYVMTASPEWFAQATPEQEKAFFQRSLQWLADKYGVDRIVTASIHRDEATPHLSAFVVPLTQDKRLSAKEFIGSRDKMRADQTSYAGCVADLGLERGIEGSKATHQTIQQHYAAVGRGVKPLVAITPKAVEPQVLRKGLFSSDVETPEAVAERLTKVINERYAGTIATAATALQERRRAKEMQDTANDLRKRLETLQGAFKGLTKDQVKEVLKVAMTFQLENKKAKEQTQAIRREQGKKSPDRGISR
ncbi:plasmid recombination enzyme [Pseudomonas sp. FSL R10-0765]|uniref:Plasmid recombination enzyme n=1 Tax=Pseudomonas helleri TaxID=1608996 RepID=A0A6A7Z0Q5_9PSED|nr:MULTISPECIES: MobV family relaxase [Pseudomonas]MQT44942.1 plasmid recombination enzyme [Pseudomonas sp. FSL R10-0765]MQT50240.1 plasmid recombination enzyme [Pseudomonas helleri]MQT78126.1 plasmid recombination enzyme [Pseudomonas helleri]MQT82881.1 plasmid recombination enzyme [Pseudomonas helleri]